MLEIQEQLSQKNLGGLWNKLQMTISLRMKMNKQEYSIIKDIVIGKFLGILIKIGFQVSNIRITLKLVMHRIKENFSNSIAYIPKILIESMDLGESNLEGFRFLGLLGILNQR